MKLDEKDLKILRLLQKNCKYKAREISKKVNSPITTVLAKIKRMEKLGVIRGYHAILDAKKLKRPITAFIFVSFTKEENIQQKQVAKEIANFPEVQEVHIVSGEWDLIVKIKDSSVESVGKFVIEKLRNVKGVEKTLTSFVLYTEKESQAIFF